MYKRLYKEANDSIPLNLELKENLIKKAQTENKNNRLNYLYRYGAIAAALVIAVGIFNIFPKTQKSDILKKPAEVTEETNQPMTRMARGVPKAISEESNEFPPAYSPTVEFDCIDWIIPDGLEVVSQSENFVEFAGGDRKLMITLMPYRGLMDTVGEIDGEKIDENSVMVSEGENEYIVYLMKGESDYKISAKNISEEDIKNLIKSIK